MATCPRNAGPMTTTINRPCAVHYRCFFAFCLQRAFPPIAFAVLGGHTDVVEYLLKQNDLDASLNGVKMCTYNVICNLCT